MRFFVIMAGRNTEQWVNQTLDSVKTQSLSKSYPATALWIDDHSDDESVLAAHENLKGLPESLIKIQANDERYGAIANYVSAIHLHANDDDIIVMLGADGDQLYGTEVFEKLTEVYQDPNVWLTYGGMISTDGNSNWVKEYDRPFRDVPMLLAVNPITFRAKLFKKIRREDLLLGYDYYPMAGDSAFTIPMMEMAGKERIRALKDILYVYNQNPESDARKDSRLQSFCHWHIRQRQAYPELRSLEENPDFKASGYEGISVGKKIILEGEGTALILLPDLGQDQRASSYEVPVRRVDNRLDLCVPFGRVK